MVAERFPARSGTTTRYLSQREVERLYAQRSALATSTVTRTPFSGFLVHEKGLGIDGARAHAAKLLVLIEPVGSYRYPGRGADVRRAMENATEKAALAHKALVDSSYASRLLDLATGHWEPQSTFGWKTGVGVTEMSGGAAVTAAATYAHSGALSFEIWIPLSDLRTSDPPYAHEQIWASETIAALALGGRFFLNVPGASFLQVDLRLWGLPGRVVTASGPIAGRPTITDNNYTASETFGTWEVIDTPETVATELLDRLLTSFGADDTITKLIQP